jgi:formylglycine-generating enzyme required for sulfatase activity/energy-coupling factor transporter ATP-binding protein EcfA2
MDYWNSIGPAGQQICIGAAGQFFGGLATEAWQKLKGNGRPLAGVYQRWREGLLDSVDDNALGAAFGEFFGRSDARRELEKILNGRFAEVDFGILEKEIRASCDFAKSPLPDTDVYGFLTCLAEGLIAALEDLPEYRAAHRPALLAAVEGLRQTEPGQRNYSLARRAYLAKVRETHRLIQFRGFDSVNEIVDVDLRQVFVMPRLTAAGSGGEEAEPFPAGVVLAKRKDSRVVILGGPGSGKTTLLSHFALALAQEDSEFRLFPVFYRMQEYQTDRERHAGKSLLECLHERWAADHNLRLPKGFFSRQMRGGGVALLLDGLDEVAVEDKRAGLVTSVSAVAGDLPEGCVVMVTSRPHEYAKTPFASDRYRHYSLCEFNDDEIRKFIGTWRGIHDATPGAAKKATRDLWGALQSQPSIRKLAGNALLLTMIVRVHWWLGQLPENRLQLYKTCAEALLHHWSVVKGLKLEGIGLEQKREFLAGLAYSMQSAADPGDMRGDVSLRIPARELRRKLEDFLASKRLDAALLGPLMERLHTRDAVLVNFGRDEFGFVHRSFQEYFAACWLAEEIGPEEMWRDRYREGWNETMYLAVAQLRAREEREFLLRLLTEEGQAEFALACVLASPQQSGWLPDLIRFLAKYTHAGRDFAAMTAPQCLHAAAGRQETLEVLSALFAPRLRDGCVLAAAIELAEELGRQGEERARKLVAEFLAEGRAVQREMVPVPAGEFEFGGGRTKKRMFLEAFEMDRYPVTNADYERMVPGHRELRDQYSDQDDQPVIYVNWYEASLYARWRGCALPTEEQWEKAAAWDGQKAREYPWEGEWDKSKANTWESKIGRTTPVTAHPGGASCYGCEDMAGNVWEWTSSEHANREGALVVRGGSWVNDHDYARCASRYNCNPENRDYNLGFRCART